MGFSIEYALLPRIRRLFLETYLSYEEVYRLDMQHGHDDLLYYQSQTYVLL